MKLFVHALDLLRDQLINLAITLVVVDRFLAWRERRRWKGIRNLVALRFEAELGDFLASWSRWLSQLRLKGRPLSLSEAALSALTKGGLPAKATLPPEDFEDFVRFCAGEPIPDPEEASFIDSVQPRNFAKELFGHLVSVSLDRQDVAWPTLISELQELIPRLASLTERIPEKANSTSSLDYRLFVEGLQLLPRKVNPKLYDESWDREDMILLRAESISHNVAAAIMAIKLLRTDR